MQDGTKITITARALKQMNPDQFRALQANVSDGRWETAVGMAVWAEWETIMVAPHDNDAKPLIMLGIEKDGYTHS